MDHVYALLLAGGRGSRLWPLSQPDRLKPLLALTEKRSLFQMTVDRLDGLIPTDYIYVVTQADLREPLMQISPTIPAQNYLCEPTSKDTAPAIGLGVFQIAQADPDAVIAIMSTDHHIERTDRLLEALRAASELAQQGRIVVLGITPTYPATEYGYIEHGDSLAAALPAFEVRRFVEKPNRETAEGFLEEGGFSWDAGFVIASARTLIAEFERQEPQMACLLKQMTMHPSLETWQRIESISFDYAILEQAHNIAVIPVEMGWRDIGSWSAVYDVLPKDEQGNATVTPHIAPRLINTQRTLVWSERPVVTIGVEDLIIVETSDALLICHRDQAQQIRHLGSL